MKLRAKGVDMNNLDLDEQIRQICKAYYNHEITFEDYRSQRKVLLDKLEVQLNGSSAAKR